MSGCKCFNQYHFQEPPPEVKFHTDIQDTECDAWKRLLDLIEEAANDKREEFNPSHEIDWEDWSQIITLPALISKLKHVKRLIISASKLVRVPPEIGEMTNLESFDAYMAYELHWYPFEITRCKNLVSSSASTRALYGNFKYRPPFPKLQPDITSTKGINLENLAPSIWGMDAIKNCSICNRLLENAGLYQAWITLRIATDDLPLLVNACSLECIQKLPQPTSTRHSYIKGAHKGGSEVKQPPP